MVSRRSFSQAFTAARRRAGRGPTLLGSIVAARPIVGRSPRTAADALVGLGFGLLRRGRGVRPTAEMYVANFRAGLATRQRLLCFAASLKKCRAPVFFVKAFRCKHSPADHNSGPFRPDIASADSCPD
jgi:hypothetical protein